MTDKEKIIIDGVDVSECAYFDYENEGTKECYAYSNECEANNCYFKQLARKTQECEELKEEYTELKLENKELYRILADLKEVRKLNDRYRKAFEDIKEYTRKQFCDNCEDIGSTEYTCHCEYCEYQEYFEIIEKTKDGSNER